MNYEFCNGYTYTIKQGDTLYEISKKLEVPLALILRANPYVDVFDLQIGDTLCIPARERPLPPLPLPGRPDRPQPPRPERPDRPQPPRPERPDRPQPPRPEGPDRPQPPRPERPDRPQPPRPEGPDRPLPPLPQPDRPQPEPGSGRPLPPLPPPSNVRMSEEEGERQDDFMEEDAWIRYVVQPGDSMAELLKNQEMLPAFIERNGLENIYLLPGIAYYVPER